MSRFINACRREKARVGASEFASVETETQCRFCHGHSRARKEARVTEILVGKILFLLFVCPAALSLYPSSRRAYVFSLSFVSPSSSLFAFLFYFLLASSAGAALPLRLFLSLASSPIRCRLSTSCARRASLRPGTDTLPLFVFSLSL